MRIDSFENIKVNIKRGDITEEDVDAIVNPANNSLLGGSGVDGLIHKKAGDGLLTQCKKIGGCPTGEARITTGGKLKARYIIHTVGPIYKKGEKDQEKNLYRAYYNSLLLAKDYGLKTVSFPAISTGAYGYPMEETLDLVYQSLRDFDINEDYKISINLILFDTESYRLYEDYFRKV